MSTAADLEPMSLRKLASFTSPYATGWGPASAEVNSNPYGEDNRPIYNASAEEQMEAGEATRKDIDGSGLFNAPNLVTGAGAVALAALSRNSRVTGNLLKSKWLNPKLNASLGKTYNKLAPGASGWAGQGIENFAHSRAASMSSPWMAKATRGAGNFASLGMGSPASGAYNSKWMQSPLRSGVSAVAAAYPMGYAVNATGDILAQGAFKGNEPDWMGKLRNWGTWGADQALLETGSDTVNWFGGRRSAVENRQNTYNTHLKGIVQRNDDKNQGDAILQGLLASLAAGFGGKAMGMDPWASAAIGGLGTYGLSANRRAFQAPQVPNYDPRYATATNPDGLYGATAPAGYDGPMTTNLAL